MSATAKTFASLGVALLGLVVYVGIFLGLAFKIAAFGYALYLGLALTVVLLVLVVMFTSAKDVEPSNG